jgi:cytochrome c oxidase assembly protein subunit 15
MAVAEVPLQHAAQTSTAEPAAIRHMRRYFLALAAASLAAFVLGVENRFTLGGLFSFPLQVDWLPPLSADRWLYSFVLHQQDPLFAACGGSESIEDYRILYWWEWLRRLSLVVLTAVTLTGLVAGAITPALRFALPRLIGPIALAALFAVAGNATERIVSYLPAISRYNVGQYRHAADVIFASIALAAVFASVARPPRPPPAPRTVNRAGWLWIALIGLDIGFGALVSARDGAKVWPTWPGYATGAFPPLEQLATYSPPWLNLVWNPYTIQLVHRALSDALWVAALAYLGWALWRNAAAARAALVMFVLTSAQMAAGVATLWLKVPPTLSIAHQIGGAVLLAWAFASLRSNETLRPART